MKKYDKADRIAEKLKNSQTYLELMKKYRQRMGIPAGGFQNMNEHKIWIKKDARGSAVKDHPFLLLKEYTDKVLELFAYVPFTFANVLENFLLFDKADISPNEATGCAFATKKSIIDDRRDYMYLRIDLNATLNDINQFLYRKGGLLLLYKNIFFPDKKIKRLRTIPSARLNRLLLQFYQWKKREIEDLVRPMEQKYGERSVKFFSKSGVLARFFQLIHTYIDSRVPMLTSGAIEGRVRRERKRIS